MSSDTNSEFLIVGENVTKVFKDFWGRPKVTAVQDVSFRVRRGQTFGLLGPNGAGKSTLIKMILGHLYPTQGTLSVFGRSPKDVDTKKLLGYVPERAAFYRTLTGEEILRLFGRVLGLPERTIDRRIDQLLDMVGMAHVRKRQVREYSHGMGRRLGIAQALLNDPDLILLDEPTAGLDPIGCHEVKQLILTLAQRGKTVLVTSHLLADVQDVCDSLLIMYGGKIQREGPTESLLAKTDEVQIRVPRVSAEVLETARSALASEVGEDNVRVSMPTRSLEDFFLDVVQQATAKDLDTSGARVGLGVAEYLQAEPTPEPLEGERTREQTPVRTPQSLEDERPVSRAQRTPRSLEGERPVSRAQRAAQIVEAERTRELPKSESRETMPPPAPKATEETDEIDRELLDRLTLR
ncbi:MAG: ABC transporter ATP-binding protein [Lentisphaeria bacterium]|nr:ABC transporter ATP-binding protein [Lentisphaeria bacterium]